MYGWVGCRWVVALAATVGMSASAARAGEPSCDDTALGRVGAAGGKMSIIVPSVPQLEPHDALLQLNGYRLRSCDDLQRAVEEARDGGLDLLLLVERGGRAHVLRIEPLAATEVAAEPIAAAANVVATEAPTRAATTAPTRTRPPPASPTLGQPTSVPTPVSAADAALVREARAEVDAFGRELRDSLPLPSSQPWLGRLRRLLDAQAERRARSDAVAVLEPILAYYETVGEILVYKEAATGDASRRRNRLELVLEYDSNSTEVNGWLRRYPFLAESVVEPPEEVHLVAHGERPGRWLPNRAIELLVERALTEARS